MSVLVRTAVPSILALALQAGCGAPPPIFPAPDPPLFWPKAGDPARFAYVGQIRGEADLKRPRSFWKRLVGFMAGPAPSAQIRAAHGVAVAPGDVLYVSDPDAHAVHRFDLDARAYRALSEAGGGRRFTTPIGLALVGERLVVADRSLKTLTILNSAGEPVSVLGEGVLDEPVGVAVGPLSGWIYVTDVASHDVKALDMSGNLVVRFGGRGVDPGRFNYPTHLACDAEENLYVADSLNSRVQVFDREGRFRSAWGERGDQPGEFSLPKGIACDRRSHIYVVDSHFENLQVFNPRGELLIAIGQEGYGPGEFWLPIGIAVGADDTIWVGDSFNHRVQVFRYLGETSEVKAP